MNISFEEFKKLDIRIGRITSAEHVEGSEKLLKLTVSFSSEQRQIVSGIAKFYQPEDLIGKQCPFILNLEPRKIMGLESQGMILAADPGDNTAILLHPEKEVPAGSTIR